MWFQSCVRYSLKCNKNITLILVKSIEENEKKSIFNKWKKARRLKIHSKQYTAVESSRGKSFGIQFKTIFQSYFQDYLMQNFWFFDRIWSIKILDLPTSLQFYTIFFVCPNWRFNETRKYAKVNETLFEFQREPINFNM